jgi:hypothetical protein
MCLTQHWVLCRPHSDMLYLTVLHSYPTIIPITRNLPTLSSLLQLVSCSCQWGEIMSVNCGQQQACSSSPSWYTSMDPWVNDIDGEKWGTWKESCPSATVHKYHVDWPGCESGPLWWEVGYLLPEPWHSHHLCIYNSVLVIISSSVLVFSNIN